MEAIIAAFVLLILGSTVGSAKVINQGYEAIVERTGKYKRTLKPGLNFVTPFLDTIVWEDTTREQLIDIKPQKAITSDQVEISVDAIIYWKIVDAAKAYYEVEDVEESLKTLVLTTLRSQIGTMKLEDTFSNRKDISQKLLAEIKDVTRGWGVELTRVEIQEIILAKRLLDSIEQRKDAEIKKQASILEAEGVAAYMDRISQVLKIQESDGKQALQFYLAQKYVDANYKLGESPNSKVVFMNPRDLNEALSEFIVAEDLEDLGNRNNEQRNIEQDKTRQV